MGRLPHLQRQRKNAEFLDAEFHRSRHDQEPPRPGNQNLRLIDGRLQTAGQRHRLQLSVHLSQELYCTGFYEAVHIGYYDGVTFSVYQPVVSEIGGRAPPQRKN